MEKEILNDNGLTVLQEKLLVMFKWFHDFCIKHKLRYYALGGTMLGAVRHNGFIPWDDDIDLGMPRKDYQRFVKLSKKIDMGIYKLENSHMGNSDFFYGYSKIYDTTTTLIEKARINVKRGIYMDIFPLDGAGTTKKDAKKIFKSVFNRYQFLIARTCALSSRRKWYKNISIIIARLVPDILVDNKKLLKKIDQLCAKYDYDTSRYVGNFLGNWGIKETMPQNYMGRPVLYKFEDIFIYGVEKYEKYLTCLYGDWRKLPPKEERASRHEYIFLDVGNGYLDVLGAD